MSSISSATAEKEASRLQQWKSALEHLETALRILDEADCPPQVGAQLDLAICRLKDVIENPDEPRGS